MGYFATLDRQKGGAFIRQMPHNEKMTFWLRTVLGFIFLCLFWTAQVYGFVRLLIRVGVIENGKTKLAAFIGMFLMIPVLIVINIFVMYVLGGGH
jgi:hypothetical protein